MSIHTSQKVKEPQTSVGRMDKQNEVGEYNEITLGLFKKKDEGYASFFT